MRPFDRERLDQTVKRFAELGRAGGDAGRPALEYPRLHVDPQAQAATLQRLGLRSTENVVALLPGAEYGPAKQWPVQSYADLAERLARVGIGVWVLGSEKERELGRQNASSAGRSRMLPGTKPSAIFAARRASAMSLMCSAQSVSRSLTTRVSCMSPLPWVLA
jgi:heptosyltransferase-2